MKDWKKSDYVSDHSGYWLDDIFSSATGKWRTPNAVRKPISAVGTAALLGEEDDDDDEEGESASLEMAIRLSAVRRAVSNFVRILTNDDKIEVKFSSGNDSYTDGHSVVIAAQPDRKDFDVMVGLALHEASHCLLTDMGLYGVILQAGRDDYASVGSVLGYKGITNEQMKASFVKSFHPDLRKYLWDSTTAENLCKLVMTLLNICEDRRIDNFVFTNASGYRPYYIALYKKYFLSKEIDKALVNDPALFKPEVESYVSRLINVMNPNASPNALKGLRKMVELMDVDHISRLSEYQPTEIATKFYDWCNSLERVQRWYASRRSRNSYGASTPTTSDISASDLRSMSYEQMYPTWQLANELLLMIVSETNYDFTQPPECCKAPDGPGLDGEGDGEESDGEGDGDELQNLDRPGNGKYNPARTEKALKSQRKFLEGSMRKKKIAKRMSELVSQMEEAGASITEVGKHTGLLHPVPVVVIEKVTESVLRSDWFGHGIGSSGRGTRYGAEEAVAKGISMGQVLVNRLQIRNDPMTTHYTRQNAGRIDRRLLSQLGMDIVSVFKRTRTESFKPVVVYITLDASGSMDGRKWLKVISVASAMSYLADKVKDIDVVVMIRGTARQSGSYGNTMPMVAVVHDSRQQRFVTARKLLAMCVPTGGTPEALCYEATLGLMLKREKSADVYFVNFSDGEPSFACASLDGSNEKSLYYSQDIATEHCRKVMHLLRDAGVKIMSYFVSDWEPHEDTKANFKRSYGDGAEFVDVSNITNILRTLQKLFSDRSGMEVSTM